VAEHGYKAREGDGVATGQATIGGGQQRAGAGGTSAGGGRSAREGAAPAGCADKRATMARRPAEPQPRGQRCRAAGEHAGHGGGARPYLAQKGPFNGPEGEGWPPDQPRPHQRPANRQQMATSGMPGGGCPAAFVPVPQGRDEAGGYPRRKKPADKPWPPRGGQWPRGRAGVHPAGWSRAGVAACSPAPVERRRWPRCAASAKRASARGRPASDRAPAGPQAPQTNAPQPTGQDKRHHTTHQAARESRDAASWARTSWGRVGNIGPRRRSRRGPPHAAAPAAEAPVKQPPESPRGPTARAASSGRAQGRGGDAARGPADGRLGSRSPQGAQATGRTPERPEPHPQERPPRKNRGPRRAGADRPRPSGEGDAVGGPGGARRGRGRGRVNRGERAQAGGPRAPGASGRVASGASAGSRDQQARVRQRPRHPLRGVRRAAPVASWGEAVGVRGAENRTTTRCGHGGQPWPRRG